MPKKKNSFLSSVLERLKLNVRGAKNSISKESINTLVLAREAITKRSLACAKKEGRVVSSNTYSKNSLL